ncbi:unnamed protein product [Lampetra fluviatilis]
MIPDCHGSCSQQQWEPASKRRRQQQQLGGAGGDSVCSSLAPLQRQQQQQTFFRIEGERKAGREEGRGGDERGGQGGVSCSWRAVGVGEGKKESAD